MDELGREFAEDVGELVSGTGIASATVELRKRRSTRIVQAVPLSVAGVDALGRPFNERTSTLIINCHGCRYQSKHYVLKNMWVSLEVPHPETGQPPRTVRGRVAWIQRPRTVLQLFQVALELELPGNAWGIAFPPEDWFAFPDSARSVVDAPAGHLQDHSQQSAGNREDSLESHSDSGNDVDFSLPLSDPDSAPENRSERVRAFPAPASTTDASMQLARQVTRLLADARQQIHAAAREAAAQAVSAERRITAEEWEQKLAADRDALSREAASALQNIREESSSLNRIAQSAAAEALQRDLAAQLSQEAMGQRNANAELSDAALQSLHAACDRAEQLLQMLREETAAIETRTKSAAESAAGRLEESTRQHESAATESVNSLRASANQIQERASAFLSAAQQSWQNHVAGEIDAAQNRVQIAVDNAIVAAQVQAAEAVNDHANGVLQQFQMEAEQVLSGFRDAASVASTERDLHLSALRDVVRSETHQIETTLARANEALAKLEHFPERIEAAQHHALTGFQTQLDDVLTLHRNELHRRSESLFEDISSRIHAQF